MTASVDVQPAATQPAALPSARLGGLSLASYWWLAGLLLVGLVVRLAVLVGPLGELDGDEAVVGLMARHIAYLGDRPVFYYGQPYLGSLEAFVAAPLFLLFGATTPVLKLVPTLFSLGFLALTALLARRLFGPGPAVATAAYLALPPSMWAVWSTKARGGYAELLFLGAALLLLTLWLAERPRSRPGALAWGLVAGLAVWTHLLAVVYLVPAAVYLLAWRRRAWDPGEVALGLLGGLVGAAPMVLFNVTSGFPTVAELLKPADLPHDPLDQLVRFFRVGLPVLAGLGQPTTSSILFDQDWLNRPAGRLPVALALLLGVGMAVALQAGAVRRLFGRRPPRAAEPALLVLLAMAVPPVLAVTRFGFFVSEPRYALPLYSAVPLVAAALWRLPRPARSLGLAALLALNAWSLLSTDVRLWRPEGAAESTAATRAELARALVAQDRHQVYADYWVAYPLMFESGESVLASVVTGGFNRYIPPADNVQRTPNAAWAVVAGSPEDAEFRDLLRAAGARARVERVAVYDVYLDVDPADALRPP